MQPNMQDQMEALKVRASGGKDDATIQREEAAEAARQQQIAGLDEEQLRARKAITEGAPVGPTDYFPAIDESKVETKMEPLLTLKAPVFGEFDVMGMGQLVERDYYAATNWKKVIPNISVQDVYNLKNPDEFALVNTANTMVDFNGIEYDMKGMSIEQKIETIDKRGALQLIDQDGDEIDIPWYKEIERLTKIPEGLDTNVLKSGIPITTVKLNNNDLERVRAAYMLTSANLANPDISRPIYAAYLNNVMLRNGVDARSRASVLRYRMSDPTMGDFENVVHGAADVVGRSIVETVLYGVGETLDFFDGMQEKFTLSSFRGRQAVADDLLPTLPLTLQKKFAQKGVFLDLSTAEDLAYTYTGLLPRAGRLAAEIMGLTKFQNAVRGVLSTGELARFERVLAKKLEKNPDLKPEEVLDTYIKNRKDEVGFFTPFNLFTRSTPASIEKRIAQGYQIVDANLPKGMRAEVVTVMGRQATLLDRKARLQARLEKRYEPSVELQIEELDEQIVRNRNALQEAERISSVPKFMRDVAAGDKFMIVGGAAAGHFFGQEFEMVDPAIGEIAGIFVGLVASASSSNTLKGMTYFKNKQAQRVNAAYADPTLSEAEKITATNKQMRFFLNQLSEAEPLFAAKIEGNALRIMNAFDKLEDQGIKREYLNTTIPVVVDLVTIRHFADTINKGLKTGEAFNANVAEGFQAAHESLRILNGELNRIVGEMMTVDDPDNQFFMFMKAMAKKGQDLEKSIENDLKLIDERGVNRYLNAILGNTKILDSDSLDKAIEEGTPATTFPDAVASLVRRKIFDLDAIDQASIEKEVGNSVRIANESLASAAFDIRRNIGIADTKEQRVKALTPVLGRKRAREVLHKNMNGSTLFAFQVETALTAARGRVTTPYALLKDPTKVKFYDANNNPLSNTPTTNGFPIIQELLQIRRSGLSPDQLPPASVDKIMVELSDPIFVELARVQKKPVNDILKDIKEGLEDMDPAKYRFVPGRSLQAQVAEYLEDVKQLDGKTAGMFNLDPFSLRKLDEVIRGEAYKASQAGRGEAAKSLYTISNVDIERTFDTFQIDGRDIGSIKIQVGNQPSQDFKTHLDTLNQNYRIFKERFYDETGGALLPNLLFNKRKNLSSPTLEFPTGVETKKLPSQWININTFLNEDQAAIYMAGVNRGLGKDMLVEGKVSPVLREGAPETVTQQEIVKLMFAKYSDDMIEQGKAGPRQIAEAANKITKNLFMVNEKGKRVPLVNFSELVDDHRKLRNDTFEEIALDEVTEKAKGQIQTQLNVATAPAREMQEGLNDAVKVLSSLSSENLRAQDIASLLIDGGIDRYDNIKSNMLMLVRETGEPKYTEDQVNEILANAYINGLRRNVFVKTGKKQVNVEKDIKGNITTTFSDLLAENPAALLKYLGETEEEKLVARKILGDDRYDTIEALAEVLTELTDNPLAGSSVNVTGIPRAMSIESYISRLYAIQRKVVRPQYVGSEAIIQQLRFKNFEFLTALVTNPKLARDFMEMVRTDQPLSPKRDAEFVQGLVKVYASSSQAFASDVQEIVDPADRKYTVSATIDDRVKMGMPIQFDPETAGGPARGDLFGPSDDPTGLGGLGVTFAPKYDIFNKTGETNENVQ